MFILTNVDMRQDLAQVFDTQDGSNDMIRLSTVANQVRTRGLKIYGLGKLGSRARQTSNPIPQLGIYIDLMEAREAFATYYQKQGMTRQMARARAGLAC